MFIVGRTRFVTIFGNFFVIKITSYITTTVVNKIFFVQRVSQVVFLFLF